MPKKRQPPSPVRDGGSAKLLVAERPPQIPAGNGSKRTPFIAKFFDIVTLAVDVCYRAFKANIPKGKHIRLAENHDPKDGERPRADALNARQCFLPGQALPYFCANFIGPLQDSDAALSSSLGKPECS